MRGTGRVKKLYQRIKRHLIPGAVILTYHRVANRAIDPYGIVVAPDRFAQHLQYIERTCVPMRLHDLIEAMQRRSIPKRAIVLTFDDGYVDFYTEAYPRLEHARLPATVFVAAGHTDSPSSRWHDELAQILLLTDNLPSSLGLTIDGVGYRWTLTSSEEKWLAHGQIYDLLLPLTPAKQRSTLDSLARWAGVERPRCTDDRAMTSGELHELARSGLIEIGAHTITHPVLSTLPPDEQYAEIDGSRRRLEALLDVPVRTFAYPYGERQHFTDQTASLVAAAGFEAACTMLTGTVLSASDRFRLRRCWVGDWSLETFRKNLEWDFLQ